MTVKLIRRATIAFLAAVSVAGAADWSYNSTNATVSHGGWTMGVTWSASTGALTVKSLTGADDNGLGRLEMTNMTVNGTAVRSVIFNANSLVNTALSNLTVDCVSRIDGTFIDKSSVRDVTIDGTLTSIPDNCFDSCVGLTNFLFKCDTITSYGWYSFGRCSNLRCPVGNIVKPGTTTFGQAMLYQTPVTGLLRINDVKSFRGGGGYMFSSTAIEEEALAKPSRTQAVRLASGRFFAGFSMMRRGAAEQPGETGLFPCF